MNKACSLKPIIFYVHEVHNVLGNRAYCAVFIKKFNKYIFIILWILNYNNYVCLLIIIMLLQFYITVPIVFVPGFKTFM
jgi:hypothetical protein